MFANLCGDDAVRNVILTTTMWSRVKADVGSQRERELRGKYWKPMLELGSGTHRFLDTHESAWSIINVFREKDQNDTLLLQEEMVDLEKRIVQDIPNSPFPSLPLIISSTPEETGSIYSFDSQTTVSTCVGGIVCRWANPSPRGSEVPLN